MIRVDEYTTVGVLKTHCFPNAFYAGTVRQSGAGWYNATNDGSFFHPTREEAEAAAVELAEHLMNLSVSEHTS